jgi:hypothetical protein
MPAKKTSRLTGFRPQGWIGPNGWLLMPVYAGTDPESLFHQFFPRLRFVQNIPESSHGRPVAPALRHHEIILLFL